MPRWGLGDGDARVRRIGECSGCARAAEADGCCAGDADALGGEGPVAAAGDADGDGAASRLLAEALPALPWRSRASLSSASAATRSFLSACLR